MSCHIPRAKKTLQLIKLEVVNRQIISKFYIVKTGEQRNTGRQHYHSPDSQRMQYIYLLQQEYIKGNKYYEY